jgi:hypothetical protein
METTDSSRGERDLPTDSGATQVTEEISDVATSEEDTLLAGEDEAKAETSGGGGKRKAGPTPPQGGKKKKKKKAKRTEDPDTDPFRKAETDNLLAVIFFRDHPYRALTHEDQEQVKASLMARLCDAAGGGPVPTFEGTRARHGRLDVACSDRVSFDWLVETISQVTLHEETALGCVPFGSEPKLIRAEVYLSGTPVSRDSFLRILGGQNRSLLTDRWVLKHQAKTPRGQLLVWGIDLDSVAALEAVNMQPHFGLGRVTFRVSRDQPQTGGK